MWKGDKCTWVFRKDPISGTGRRKHSWKYTKAAQKKGRFRQERKAVLGNAQYTRPKRIKGAFYPDRWDDSLDLRGDVYIKRSWKKIKKRKQWM